MDGLIDGKAQFDSRRRSLLRCAAMQRVCAGGSSSSPFPSKEEDRKGGPVQPMKYALACFWIVHSIFVAAGEPMKIVGVIDGDTVVAYRDADRLKMRCRLAGIDAPEKSQAYGQQSKRSLSDMVFGRVVDVTVTDRDRYGRSICGLRADGLDVNRAQVERGFAWVYRQYNRDPAYMLAEANAKRARRGLWADSAAVPPWEYRHAR
jgi:endonuclease YncB( thermonuclease family)